MSNDLKREEQRLLTLAEELLQSKTVTAADEEELNKLISFLKYNPVKVGRSMILQNLAMITRKYPITKKENSEEKLLNDLLQELTRIK